MAFDPDVYLASRTAAADTAPLGNGNVQPKGFDPDAYLAAKAPAEPQPDRGALNAAGQGALQGVSFGFWDEAASALKALAEGRETGRGGPSFGERYRKNVGEERAQLHAAQEQHPIASTLGQVGGGVATSLIPGVGLASLGRGFAANAARGAGAGILTGAGESEAKDVSGVVSDAAKGGLVGGAVGGIGGTLIEKGMAGAQGRVDKRLVQDITGGRATAAGKAVYRNEDLVVATAKKFGLDPEASDPAALVKAAREALKEAGGAHGEAFKAIDSSSLGVRVADTKRAVRGVLGELQSPSDAPVRKQVESYLAAIDDRWGDAKRIPLQDLNKEIGKLEKVGFAGADLSPAAGKQLKRSLADALDGVLERRLEEVKDLGGKIARSSLAQREGFKGMATASEAAQALPDLNRDYRGLKLIMRAAEDRAGLPEASKAAGGLRNAVGKAVDASLLFTHPLGFAAKKIADTAGPALVNATDKALAQLVAASQRGQVTAQLIQQAIQAGVPRGLASRFTAGVVSEPTP